MVADTVSEFAGRPPRSVASAEVSPDGEDDETAESVREMAHQQHSGLLAWMATVLVDHVTDVRLSYRLTTSAARVVNGADDSAIAWERSYITRARMPHGKGILDLNPQHVLVAGLRTAFASCAGEPDSNMIEVVELLHSVAVIADGAELEDPSRFARLLSSRLALTL
jgi:molecular chaperone HtpG